MSDLTPQQIQANCALENNCECALAGVDNPWQCPNWGRSSLSMPKVLTHGRSTFITEFRDQGLDRIRKSNKIAAERGLPTMPHELKERGKHLKRKIDGTGDPIGWRKPRK